VRDFIGVRLCLPCSWGSLLPIVLSTGKNQWLPRPEDPVAFSNRSTLDHAGLCLKVS